MNKTPCDLVYDRVSGSKVFRSLLVVCLGLAFGSVQAQTTNTWSGSTSALWGTGSNWTNGVAPTNGASVSFTGGSNLNTTNDLTGLVLSNSAANGFSLNINSGSAVSIAGNQLTIGTGGAGEIQLYGAGQHTISANLNLTDVGTFINFNGTKTISGVMSGTKGAGGPNEVQLRGDNATDRLILSGVNTFDVYQTILQRGTFQVSSIGNATNAGSLGKTALIYMGVADWNATIDYVGTGESTDRKIRIGSNAGATQTGSASLLNNGSGALVWTAATLNDYASGADILANRILTLGGTNADNNEIRSIISNNKATGGGTGFSDTNGTIGITKTGTGRWILSGSNSFSGGVNVAQGTLELGNASALGSGGVTLSGGILSPGANSWNITNNLTLSTNSAIGGAGDLTLSSAVGGANQVLTIVGGGAVTLDNAGNTFGSGLTGTTAGLVVDGGTLRNGVNNAVNSNLIAQVKSGTWDLNGYNQTVRSEWSRGLLLGDAAGSSAPTITTGAGTLTIQGESVSGAQARIDYRTTGNPLGGVINGNVAYSSPANVLAVTVGESTNAAIDLTINAVISKVGGGGGGNFLKGDTGTVLLNGLNTFNVSSLRVDDGTLILGVNDPANGSAGALGQGTAQVTVGFNVTGNRDATLLLRDGVTSARSVRTMNNPNTGRAGDIRTLGGYDSTGTSTFSGRIELFNAANDGGTTRLQALGTSTVNFSGQIVDDTTTTAVGINKIGSGTVVLSGNNAYRGSTTVNDGTLVVSNSVLLATILSNSTTVNFSTPPGVGTNNVLPGPLNTASLASPTVTGLGANFSGRLTNAPNLQVVVTSNAAVGPTFASTYPSGSENTVGPNGLQNLMSYALGGTGPSSSPALPVLTPDGSNLTLTANIRNSGQGVVVVGQYAYSLEGPWNDVELTATGATSTVPNTTVKAFSQAIESGQPKKFLRLKATLTP